MRAYNLGPADPMPAWQARLEMLLGTRELVYGLRDQIFHAETDAPLGTIEERDSTLYFRPNGFGADLLERGAWPDTEVRAWIERHGGNLTALARRLDVPRTLLQKWAASRATHRDARTLPKYIAAHMQTMDVLQAWLARWGDDIPADARAELEAVLRGEA